MIPRHTIRPDPLPPHLLWPNVRALHGRYVLYSQSKKIGHLKWVIAAYEGALRQYREHKLDSGVEGESRLKERAVDRMEVDVQREARRNKGGRSVKGRRGFRGLDDFEGLGYVPREVGKGKKEYKVLRVHGQRALERFQRASKQF